MRPFVLSLGTGDEKRRRTGRKNRMWPSLPAIRGFDFASLCVIAGMRSPWRKGRREEREEKRKEEREKRQSSVGMPAVCLFISLLHRLSSNSPNNKEESFPLNQDCSRTHHQLAAHACCTFPSAVNSTHAPPDGSHWLTRTVLLNNMSEVDVCWLCLYSKSPYSPSCCCFLYQLLQPLIHFLCLTLSHLTSISSCSLLPLHIITHLHMRHGAKLCHLKKNTHCPNLL